MTAEEIFAKLAQHQIKGMMIHEQLSNYYAFLGLDGYSRCHEYHYMCENLSYRKLNKYFICHHNKLVSELPIENPKVIPASWYQYSRMDVDNATKKNAVKNGLQLWKDWEKETKDLYEDSYNDLLEAGEVASAMFVGKLVCDVDEELKEVEKYCLTKKALDYDMEDVMAEQNPKQEHYKKMEKELKLC